MITQRCVAAALRKAEAPEVSGVQTPRRPLNQVSMRPRPFSPTFDSEKHDQTRLWGRRGPKGG
jgi:hypothetical protein